MDNIKINIKNDFSDSPGARYKKDGPHSGEEFLNEHLRPKYIQAIKNKVQLEIELDGVWGYPSSFVSGSFGKLSLEMGADQVLNTIKFISNDSTTRLNRIIEEINLPLTIHLDLGKFPKISLKYLIGEKHFLTKILKFSLSVFLF